MADIRDSIALALQKTVSRVSSNAKSFGAAATPAVSPDAAALMERAQQKLKSIKDSDMVGDSFIHTDDMDVAILLSAMDQATPPIAKAALPGVHKYDDTDPNWIAAAVEMMLSRRAAYVSWQNLSDFRVQMPDDDLVIGLAGDWGTGLLTSNQIANQIAARKPHLTIHIGDVYYSGTEDEVRSKFLAHWPRGSWGSFALNSNHEMYAGGLGYFNVTLKNSDFAAHQQASYFCLYNSKWQIIALDSAYDSAGGVHLYQNGNLRPEQVEWLRYQLRQAEGRTSVILSHHNPIAIDGTFDQPFFDQVLDAAYEAPFAYWFFGHEHDVAVYRSYTRKGITFLPRCIGHGGIPYSPEAMGMKANNVFVEWTEQQKYVAPHDTRAGLNGFAMLKLPKNGGVIEETYFDDSGNLRYSVGVAAQPQPSAPPKAAQPQPAASGSPDKVLIINRGKTNAEVQKGLDSLVAADKARGIATIIIAIDDAGDMAKVNAQPVAASADSADYKTAIDAVYNALTPDYLVIVGGPDVIPHQQLENPLDDGDPIVYSDLPYACEAAGSSNIGDFTGPTRVVGRIPSLPGAADSELLLTALATAANWHTRPASAYGSAFGLSTVEWQQSTQLSVSNLFGSKVPLLLSPDGGPNWGPAQLSPLAHFINCHGALNDPKFYGQSGDEFPPSYYSGVLAGMRFDGTIVAAECCYGAWLYPPTQGDWAIPARYLGGGAYGYFGSTTIAYGPAEGNGQADILCQSFLKKAISGSSLGRAALEARQEYLSSLAEMQPQDLKTIAQFHLLGDPSIQPVSAPAAKSMGFAAASPSAARSERRRTLAVRGQSLHEHRAVASKLAASNEPALAKLREKIDLRGIEETTSHSYTIERHGVSQTANAKFAMKAMGAAPTNVHVIVGRRRHAHPNAQKLPNIVAFVAKESGGEIVSYTELHSK